MRRLRQHRSEGSDRSRPAQIMLDASLEVRSAIVYATLIDVVGAAADLLPAGPVGRVLPAAGARPTGWPCWRRMVVALTVTPALCAASCCATRRSSAGESPLVRWLQRGYDAVLAPIIRSAAAGATRAVGVVDRWPASLVAAAAGRVAAARRSRSATS